MNKEYMFDFAQTDKWKSHLETEGYVVVTGVLADVAEAISLYMDQFQNQGHDGFIDENDFCHSKFAWYCRTRPNVLSVFQKIFGLQNTSDLISSFDRGTCIQTPSNSEDDTAYWLHIDYPLFSEQPMRCNIYQSFLSLVDAGGSDASPGLRVVPWSYLCLDQVRKDVGPQIDNRECTHWQISPAFADELVDKEKAVVSVYSPAGSLTIWKSGLIHDNTTATARTHGLSRLVVYLSYAPRLSATKEELEWRKHIYRKGQITTHWPAQHLSLHSDATYRWKHKQMMDEFPEIKFLV